MKTQPRQHISNKYNTYTVVTSPVYIGSKVFLVIISGDAASYFIEYIIMLVVWKVSWLKPEWG